MKVVIQLLTAFLGSLGFSILFGLRIGHLFFAAFGGFGVWGIYLMMDALTGNLFFSSLCAAIFAVSYAELMAHLRKCPSTLFVIPAIIPLVPGSSLYYAMSSAVMNDLEAARQYGQDTLICSLAIAAGISLVEVFRDLRTSKAGQNSR